MILENQEEMKKQIFDAITKGTSIVGADLIVENMLKALEKEDGVLDPFFSQMRQTKVDEDPNDNIGDAEGCISGDEGDEQASANNSESDSHQDSSNALSEMYSGASLPLPKFKLKAYNHAKKKQPRSSQTGKFRKSSSANRRKRRNLPAFSRLPSCFSPVSSSQYCQLLSTLVHDKT